MAQDRNVSNPALWRENDPAPHTRGNPPSCWVGHRCGAVNWWRGRERSTVSREANGEEDAQFLNDDALCVGGGPEWVGLQVGKGVRLGIVQVVPLLETVPCSQATRSFDTGWFTHLHKRKEERTR